MAALPYIQLYVADYLADTIHLNAEEHGAYLLIIMNYWQTGKPVPIDRLQSITGINGRWDDVQHKLQPYFEEINGCWYHERIEGDLNKVKSKSIQASKAGKKSAEVRLLKNKDNSTDVQRSIQQTFNHTEAEADTEADIKHKNKPSPKSVNGVPYQKIIDLYHEELPTLPRVEKLTASRKSYIRQRWLQDLKTLDNWENYFNYVKQSKFLMGMASPVNGRKPFIANLEWLVKEANFVKIKEENYHG